MIHHPSVIVHGLPHARLALSVGRAVTLLSAPGAAVYAGCSWWFEMMQAARREFPQARMVDFLDCADAPGRAMAALRVGQRRILLLPCPALADVIAAAESVGATLLTQRPRALDLAHPKAARELAAWLTVANAPDGGPPP